MIYHALLLKDIDFFFPTEIEDSSKLTMIQGAAQAYVFFLAGFETSSALISHCLYELALNPDIQEAVHKDIDSAMKKHGGLTFDSINDMTYLHKVVRGKLLIYHGRKIFRFQFLFLFRVVFSLAVSCPYLKENV